MRILITTGLSQNDIGGPFQYASKLKSEFEKFGHIVRIVQYRSVESALFKIWSSALWADNIIALDTFSVGVPSVLAGKLLRKKVAVRIGGDFLWESYVERTGKKINLREFNSSLPEFNFKEKMIFQLTKFLVKNSYKLVFNTEWQRDIWQKAYDVSPTRSCLVRNYIPPRNISPASNTIFLWSGRKIKLKNLDLLREAARDVNLEITSNISHDALQEKIKNCYAVVLPSFSEVCPNFILEAASYGKPFIMTGETGLKEIYNKGGIFVNPFDEDGLKRSLLEMSNLETYQKYVEEIKSVSISHSWEEIAKEFLNICR